MKNNKDLDDLIAKLNHIDIVVNATHLNYINSNSLFYTIDAAKSGGTSWIIPYKKPQLLYHDKQTDAVGRVMDYSIKDKAEMPSEPNNFIKLNIRITDKEAISKVIKGIYYTCSVGSSTSKVRCSECNQVLTTDGLCEHEKGTVFEGKKVYWIVDNITYKENSFVNNPADSYSRIVSIDIGNGPIDYDKFLEDKDEVLTQFFMEDNMQNNTDAKLSTSARNKLSESAFCGPGRSFPAHDKAHVTAGLRLLNRSNFSESTKDKIKACLYRKGKKYGIGPATDELISNPELITYRLSDDWTEEEKNQIAEFFKENTDTDLATKEDYESNDNVIGFTIFSSLDLKDTETSEILQSYDKIVEEYNKILSENKQLKTDETKLHDEISKQNTILISREDEIKKLMIDNAHLSINYKKALIDNILDMTKHNDDRAVEFKKYESRKIDSILDTLEDSRKDYNINYPRIKDETLIDSKESNNKINNSDKMNLTDNQKSKIDRFFKQTILTEE